MGAELQDRLTQEHEAAVVLEHHIPVEHPLSSIKILPLIPGEVQRDVLK